MAGLIEYRLELVGPVELLKLVLHIIEQVGIDVFHQRIHLCSPSLVRGPVREVNRLVGKELAYLRL